MSIILNSISYWSVLFSEQNDQMEPFPFLMLWIIISVKVVHQCIYRSSNLVPMSVLYSFCTYEQLYLLTNQNI